MDAIIMDTIKTTMAMIMKMAITIPTMETTIIDMAETTTEIAHMAVDTHRLETMELILMVKHLEQQLPPTVVLHQVGELLQELRLIRRLLPQVRQVQLGRLNTNIESVQLYHLRDLALLPGTFRLREAAVVVVDTHQIQ